MTTKNISICAIIVGGTWALYKGLRFFSSSSKPKKGADDDQTPTETPRANFSTNRHHKPIDTQMQQQAGEDQAHRPNDVAFMSMLDFFSESDENKRPSAGQAGEQRPAPPQATSPSEKENLEFLYAAHAMLSDGSRGSMGEKPMLKRHDSASKVLTPERISAQKSRGLPENSSERPDTSQLIDRIKRDEIPSSMGGAGMSSSWVDVTKAPVSELSLVVSGRDGHGLDQDDLESALNDLRIVGEIQKSDVVGDSLEISLRTGCTLPSLQERLTFALHKTINVRSR